MAKLLDQEAIDRYRGEGYCFPIDVLDAREAAASRARLEAFEATQGKPIHGPQRSKSHLLFKWVDDLMRHPRILDAVEDLIGPDLLCWNTIFWIKEANSPSFVSWHQDARYWGLDTSELVTAWLALSPATEASGCMKVLPRSHLESVLPHRDEYHGDNMLTRGQEIAVEVDESKTVSMPLATGQASLHNVGLAHASGPNRTADRRIGISMHYISTRTRQTAGEWDSAALVRGEDRYGHFQLAPAPSRDFDPDLLAFHERASGALRDILFRDAERVRPVV